MSNEESSTVLIIAPSNDIHALTVAKRLQASGGRAIILDSASYPSQCRLRHAISDSAIDFELSVNGETLTAACLVGVWWRRPNPYLPAESLHEAHVRRFVMDEARHAFEGWLASLGSAVINPVFADAAAARKPYQLACARALGLPISETLITNAPSDVQRFLDDGDDAPVVFKSLSGSFCQLVETRRLTVETRSMLDAVTMAPVIFQREVPDKLDIRATVIDDRVFAVSVRPRRPAAELDCRLDLDAEFHAHALPVDVSSRLISLLDRLGLRYGAVDLVLAKGVYTFLEINPGGQWLFAEIYGGQAISEAIARALLTPPRHNG